MTTSSPFRNVRYSIFTNQMEENEEALGDISKRKNTIFRHLNASSSCVY